MKNPHQPLKLMASLFGEWNSFAKGIKELPFNSVEELLEFPRPDGLTEELLEEPYYAYPIEVRDVKDFANSFLEYLPTVSGDDSFFDYSFAFYSTVELAYNLLGIPLEDFQSQIKDIYPDWYFEHFENECRGF
jgi:hypothetical protein